MLDGTCLVYIWILSLVVFFFKQKTAYEMRISDWSSDVCSSDLEYAFRGRVADTHREFAGRLLGNVGRQDHLVRRTATALLDVHLVKEIQAAQPRPGAAQLGGIEGRSEERRVGKECVSTCRSRWSPYH